MSAADTLALKASAVTFAIQPTVGAAGAAHAVTGSAIAEVHGDLKTTVVLLSDGLTHLCLITSSVPVQTTEMRQAIYGAVAESAGLQPEQVIFVSSHNHCVPAFIEPVAPAPAPGFAPLGRLNALGREFIGLLRAALAPLPGRLEPVTVEWGVSPETRFTYNRRGRRPDGRAYFIREEDRLLLGEDYRGEIDPDASVVLFRGARGVVAALAHFTGHPVTAYRPERMIVFGEYPQVAGEILAERLGAPVAFLQGCAGDINAKHLLTGTVAQARQFGEWLAESFLKAVEGRRPSARSGLRRHGVLAQIPLAPLPPVAELQRDLDDIRRFVARGRAGDEDTRECVGMNFPRALTPPYRARLVEMVQPWYEWALRVQAEGRGDSVLKSLPVAVEVVRIGDVGLVALPFEPFVRTGLKLKREAPLPCILPCGYSGGFSGGSKCAYIPDASAADDREYMGGFFRYTRNIPPYQAPAGDAAATAGVRALEEILL
ncbi:MAG: hypothetical protein JNG83_09400 [Opitutaceae bacterium]|nr:hypothetical protein [Opitutaceae bacterium]